MSFYRFRKEAFLLSLALLLWPGRSGPLPSQAQKAENQKALEHEVTVTLKLVQVYVTDGSGKPVLDLDKSDFTVSDNGVAQEITAFEQHVIPGQAPGETLPVSETIVATPLPEPEQMNRKFILIFDFAFNNSRGVVKAKEAALHFIDTQLLPTDEVAVFSYSVLRSLTLHEYLTTDHTKIRQTVEAVTRGEVGGRAFEIEEQYWKNRDFDYQTQRVEGAAEPAAAQQGKLREIQEMERRDSKLQAFNFLKRMTELAKAFRYIPGQKNVVLFSSGIPASLLSGTGQMVGVAKLDFGDYRLRTQNEELLKEWSASNCLVFSFDTRAKDLDMFRDDSETFITEDRRIQLDARVDTIYYRDSKTGGEGTLRRFSGATGGKYFGNIDRYEGHLQELQDLTGSYYVLGYSIDEKWDGQYHAIKVGVKRKGCRVYSQTGYFSPKPFREYSDFEKKLQLLDLALNEKPLFQTPQPLVMKPLVFSWSGQTLIFLLSEIPASVMKKFSGKTVELVALISDEQKNLVKVEGMAIEPGEDRGRNVIFSTGARLRPGRYGCRLVVRDLDMGEAAVANADAVVVKPAEKNFTLGQPLLLVPGAGPLYVEQKRPEKKGLPAWADIYSFDRRAFSPLLSPLPREGSKILALTPYSERIPSPGDIHYQAYLVGLSSRQNVPVPCAKLELLPRAHFQVQPLELEVGPLEPGEYALYIMARNSFTGEASYAQTTLWVR
jgi:VWFA-related protein